MAAIVRGHVARDTKLPPLGKYQLVKRLAMGGMAEVFLARVDGPMGFEKQVVVKRVLPHLAEEQTFVEMFFSEARLAAQLSHPNVVQVFDFGEVDGTYFLVMELIDGINLRQLGRRAQEAGEALPAHLVARIISSAAEGLGYAHELTDPATGAPLNLVHRDISPENILLSKSGAVKVVDFGIAKAANQSHLTRTGTVKGKFAYMPPEQLRAEPLDRRADVYALGIVMFELLAGQKPFDTKSDAEIAQAILSRKMTPLHKLRRDVPKALQRIVERALEPNAKDRYPDCLQLQADLERFIASTGEPIAQHHIAQAVQRFATPSKVAAAAQQGTPAPSPSRPGTPARPGSAVGPPAQPRAAWRYVIAAAAAVAVLGVAVAVAVVLRPKSAASAPAPAPVATVPVKVAPPAVVEPAAVVKVAAPVDAGVVAVAPTEPPPAVVKAPVAPAEAPPAIAKAPAPKKPPPPAPATRPPEEPAAVRPPPPAAVAEQGVVEFRVRPFGSVYVDGRLLGDTPLSPATLPVGIHSVRVVNSELGKEVSRAFEVQVGRNIFRHNFEE